MPSPEHIQPHPSRKNHFTAANVLQVLHLRGWLRFQPSDACSVFCERAATLLGPHAADSEGLQELLTLIFHYDASQILQTVDAHAVLSRYAARDVIRELALFLLDPIPFDSDRFKELVTLLKDKLELRGRDLFYPLRLALAGRTGEGELDRVILLVDEAAPLPFSVPITPIHSRILEFCSLLD